MDWREAWRDHLAPQMTTEELEHLRRGVLADDPAIVRQAFWRPTSSQTPDNGDPLTGGCLLMYGAWKAGYAPTVEVAKCLLNARVLPHADAPRTVFYSWADRTPRADVLRAFLPEVSRVLAQRADVAALAARARPRKGVPA